MTNDPCREAFEKWFGIKHNRYNPKTNRYPYTAEQDDWFAWQAAWQARADLKDIDVPNIPSAADNSQNVEYEN